ncbi:MAG: hypothetical protein HW386_1561 [Gammaproteobacteria bacterium]|nr:hypothetical protein [Gammaproteobacteria bacterium]
MTVVRIIRGCCRGDRLEILQPGITLAGYILFFRFGQRDIVLKQFSHRYQIPDQT